MPGAMLNPDMEMNQIQDDDIGIPIDIDAMESASTSTGNGSGAVFTDEELKQLREMGYDIGAVARAQQQHQQEQQTKPNRKFQNVQRVGRNKVLSSSTLGTGGIDPFLTMDSVRAKSNGLQKGTSSDYLTTQHTGVIRAASTTNGIVDIAGANSDVVGFVPPNMRGMPSTMGSKKHFKGARRNK